MSRSVRSVAIFSATLLLAATLTAVYRVPTASATALPDYRYTKTFDVSLGSARGNGVISDKFGDVYVTGLFSSIVNFAGPDGSDTITDPSTTNTDDSYITKYNPDGSYAWTKVFDNANGWANGQAVAVDTQGNIYAAGLFSGTVVFDGVGGSDSQTDAGGTNDTYLTKYNANGSYAWTKTFNTSSGDAEGMAVATDSHGAAYLTGQFDGTVAPHAGTSLTDVGGQGDAFIAKYATDGSFVWAKAFDTSGGGWGYGGSIVVDKQDDVYAGGTFVDSSIVFDVSDGTSYVGGDGNTYIAEYGSDGTYKGVKTFDVTHGGYSYGAYGLAMDSQGNLYSASALSGTVNFAGSSGSDLLTANGIKGVVTLTKFNVNGSYAWTKALTPTGGWSYGQAVAVDSLDNIYETGQFYGTAAFNGTGDVHVDGRGYGDTFLTKYNADGSYAWTKTQGASDGQSWGQGVTTDPANNVYFTGGFQDTIIFDGIGGSDSRTAGQGMFLTSYGPTSPDPVTTTTTVTKRTSSASASTTSSVVSSVETTPADNTVASNLTQSDNKKSDASDAPSQASNSNLITEIVVGSTIVVIGAGAWLIAAWRRKNP